MAFWKWRSSSRSDVTPPPPADDGSPLVLLTRGGRLSGRARTDGRRVTDVLNESDELVMQVESRDEVYAGGSPWDTAPPSWDGGASARSATESLLTDDILVVIPPAHQSSRQMQIHRRTRRVSLQIGPYRVEGHAHVTPGVPLDAYVARLTSRFIPLTRVHIEGPGINDAELPFDTAIVNVRAIIALEALS